MDKKYIFATILCIAILGLGIMAARRSAPPAQRGEKIKVAASFYPLYFFASQIGGEKADVMNITPAGAEPHDYEPSAGDIAEIEQSTLLILNGNGLEPWGKNIKKNIDARQTEIITAGEGLAARRITEQGRIIADPHVWLSPTLAKEISEKILQGLVKKDPARGAYYQSGADALKTKLDDLDRAYRSGLAHCAQKNFITSHAAFGYLAAEYGLTQIPIAGLSPDEEPSPAQLADVVKFVKMNRVTDIFSERLASPKLSETIARETGARTLILDPIEGLTPEDLAGGKNYFTEMRQNLTNLKIALQCP